MHFLELFRIARESVHQRPKKNGNVISLAVLFKDFFAIDVKILIIHNKSYQHKFLEKTKLIPRPRVDRHTKHIFQNAQLPMG